MNNIWLDPIIKTNHFKSSYFEGFIDISGGDLNIRNSGNLYVDGGVYARSSTATQFINLSDYRIKSQVIPMNKTNYSVDNLKPVYYNNIILNKPDIGFIAHEVQDNFPFLVSGNKDDIEYQSVNYIGIIGLLVHEIQLLKMKITEQNIRLDNLENGNL